jgi:hypothetical protein
MADPGDDMAKFFVGSGHAAKKIPEQVRILQVE